MSPIIDIQLPRSCSSPPIAATRFPITLFMDPGYDYRTTSDFSLLYQAGYDFNSDSPGIPDLVKSKISKQHHCLNYDKDVDLPQVFKKPFLSQKLILGNLPRQDCAYEVR